MTPKEVELILSNGLFIFPIFQEYGGGNSVYNAVVSSGTIIYFAVDYDPQPAEIQNYVVPYFEGVFEALLNSNNANKYLVGVYGKRTLCN